MMIRSIRGRIQLWYSAVLFVVVAAFVTAICLMEYRSRIADVDLRLQRLLVVALPMVRMPPPRSGLKSQPGRPPPFPGKQAQWGTQFTVNDGRLTPADPAMFFKGWGMNGGAVLATEFQPPALRSVEEDLSITQDFEPRTLRGYRIVRVNDPRNDGLLLWAGYDLAAVRAAMLPFIAGMVGIGIAVWMGVLIAGWFIIGSGLRVIEQMRQTAERIEKGDFQQRIDVEDTQNELGALAAFLNRTFDRLNAAYRQQVRFTADASHEMRTPLAVILSRAQLALRRERSAEAYREALESCANSARHMKELIDSLQKLTRLDAQAYELAIKPGDLAATTEEVLQLIEALAEEEDVSLAMDLEPTPCLFDDKAIRQVLLNLLGNAVVYCRPGDTVTVRTRRRGKQAVLEVQDTGPGITPKHVTHLFDRFYRVDKSRDTRDGHTGLGLSICKAIVEAHGGTIAAVSELGKGSCFTVILPAS